jgi:hypothetical protein
VPGTHVELYDGENYTGQFYQALSYVTHYQEFTPYVVNLTAFNDKASSAAVYNQSTRPMYAELHEDYNGSSGNHYIYIVLPPMLGDSYYGVAFPKLKDVNINANCSIFCTNSNNRLSSVKVFWANLLSFSPPFDNLVNTNIIIDSPSDPPYRSLQKSISTSAWDAGASSLNEPFGNGDFIEFQIDALNTDYVVGASFVHDSNPSYESVDFGVHVAAGGGGVLKLVRAGSVVTGGASSYSLNDVITIKRVNPYIYFYKNSTYMGKISCSTQTMYFDCAIYSPGAYIRKIDFGF